jgi:hypothetical protein
MTTRGYCNAKLVMPGLVPGIHVLDELCRKKSVDGRDKPGHGENEMMRGCGRRLLRVQ